MLRIGIDGYFMPEDAGDGRGLGMYVHHLVRTLPSLLMPDEALVLFVPASWRGSVPDVQVVRADRRASQYTWEQRWLPQMARRAQVEVLHAPANTRPWFSPVPVVTTVHDMIMFERSKRGLYESYVRWMTARAMTHSARVLTVSNASRAAMAARFARSAQVDVVYHGLPCAVDTQWSTARAAKVVHFAHRDPRKNTPVVIALARTLPDVEFVLLGMTADAIRALVGEDLPANVTALGFVTEVEKELHLRTALALLYVSGAEGFGLPVLEAMARGCIAIISEDPAIVEIGGDAALSCAVRVEFLRAAIERLRADPGYADVLREKGLTNMRRFDWHVAAARVLAVYRDVAGRQVGR